VSCLRGAGLGLLLLAAAGCPSTPATPAPSALRIDGMPSSAPVNTAVAFQVTALDKAGATFTAYRGTVTLTSDESGALATGAYAFTDADRGVHTFHATFHTQGSHAVTVADGPVQGSATLTITPPLATRLVYTDPPSGGTVRLVRNAATTDALVVLDVVTTAPISGFAVGMNVPLVTRSILLDGSGIVPGAALPAGSSPPAAAAALPAAGPLAGFLVSGLSQKAGGSGAVPTDSAVPAGAVLYTLRLGLSPTGVVGVIFDGSAPGAGFVAAVRDRAGNDVVPFGDFRLGRLEAL
jgi:hypothetical protein